MNMSGPSSLERNKKATFTHHLVKANRRILEESLSSDVIITTENGVEIPSHKCFLIAHSPVLQRMLEGGLKEAKSGRISINDISEKGVRTFLRFIYHGDMIGPGESLDLAYEILYAAHKYEVSDLENIMKTYWLERKDEDFGASMAFKIYCFVRGIDTARELKEKVIRIMRTKYAEVKNLPEFNEVFLKNPTDAIELCNNLMEAPVRVQVHNPPVMKKFMHSSMPMKKKPSPFPHSLARMTAVRQEISRQIALRAQMNSLRRQQQ